MVQTRLVPYQFQQCLLLLSIWWHEFTQNNRLGLTIISAFSRTLSFLHANIALYVSIAIVFLRKAAATLLAGVGSQAQMATYVVQDVGLLGCANLAA